MPDDKNQNNSAYSPSSLIGRRFGGFRDDMTQVSSASSKQQNADQQTTNSQLSELDHDEYKKIIDTRSVEEIEAENEKLEQIVAPGQNLEPESELETWDEPKIKAPDQHKELKAPNEELEIEAPDTTPELEEPEQELEIEAPRDQIELIQPKKDLEIEIPDQPKELESVELSTTQVPITTASTKSYSIDQKNQPKEENISSTSQEEKMADPTTASDKIDLEIMPAQPDAKKDPVCPVTTMPPNGRFKFKGFGWYWHVVKKPSLGLALFWAIVYSLQFFFPGLPGVVWSILDILTFLFSIYIFFIVASRVVRSRLENRSQAILAGFMAGVTVGLIMALFRVVYVFKIWTLVNMVVEPIVSGIIAGLITGLISLALRKRSYNQQLIQKSMETK